MQDSITHEALEALSKKATQGVWQHTFRGGHTSEGEINSNDHFLMIVAGGNYSQWRDAPDGGEAEFKANGDFVCALVNAYRTGQLIHAVPSDILSPDAIRDCLVTTVLATPAQPSGDVVEAVARAIMVTNGACFVKDWTTERRDNPHVALAWDQATAAITAYEAASGVAKMREAVAVPRGVIAFLKGRAPLKGVWFGERHPTEPGAYWWRKYLPNPEASGEKP